MYFRDISRHFRKCLGGTPEGFRRHHRLSGELWGRRDIRVVSEAFQDVSGHLREFRVLVFLVGITGFQPK